MVISMCSHGSWSLHNIKYTFLLYHTKQTHSYHSSIKSKHCTLSEYIMLTFCTMDRFCFQMPLSFSQRALGKSSEMLILIKTLLIAGSLFSILKYFPFIYIHSFMNVILVKYLYRLKGFTLNMLAARHSFRNQFIGLQIWGEKIEIK